MDAATIVSFITSVGMIGSMTLNWVQYRSGKKGRDLANLEKQIQVLERLQSLTDKQYEEALKDKDSKINKLTEKVMSLQSKVDEYLEQVVILQGAVNTLIGAGCKRAVTCQQRSPLPSEELGDILGITDKD